MSISGFADQIEARASQTLYADLVDKAWRRLRGTDFGWWLRLSA